MSKAFLPVGQIPDCCRGCAFVDWNDDNDSGYDTAWCRRGLIFPTKKKDCAMRNKPYKHQQERKQ